MNIIQRRAERHLAKLRNKQTEKLTKAAYLFADSLEEGDQAGRFRFTTRDGRPLVILAALDDAALGLVEEEDQQALEIFEEVRRVGEGSRV
jgi:hypothetical protein